MSELDADGQRPDVPDRPPEADTNSTQGVSAESSDGRPETDQAAERVPASGEKALEHGEPEAGPAETRTRAEYAEAMRSEPAVETDSVAGATAGHDSEPESSNDRIETDPGGGLAELRTREEVASETRESGADWQDETPADADEDAAFAAGDVVVDADTESGQRDLAEPRTRQEVAEEARAADPPVDEGQDGVADSLDQAALDRQATAQAEAPEPELALGTERSDAAQPGAEVAQSDDQRQPSGDASDTPEGGDATGPPGEGQEAARESPDSWPPPQSDVDHARAYYQEWLAEVQKGREEGTNVVGEKPDRSPGDTSDLPPTGQELVETHEDSSPFERFRNKYCENADDLNDGLKEANADLHGLFGGQAPAGHPETAIPHVVADSGEQHHLGADGPNIVTVAMVTGVVVSEGVRRVHDMLERRKAEHDGHR